MSAEKWESVTWDWIEREIVDYILIASKKPSEAQSFFSRLAKASEAANPLQQSADAQRRSATNA